MLLRRGGRVPVVCMLNRGWVLFNELPHAQMAAFFLDLALRWRGRKPAFKPCGRGLAALATEMAERAGSICALRALQIDRAK